MPGPTESSAPRTAPGTGQQRPASRAGRADPKVPGAVRAAAGRGDGPRTPSRWNRVGWKSITVGVLVWCILWNKADLRTILGGLAVVWGVALVFPLPAIRYRGRIRPLAVLRLVAVTLVDLVISSVRVALLAIDWRRPVRNAIVGVRLRTTSDLLVAMIIELIGLVPGSVVVEHVRTTSRIYVHVLDVHHSRLQEAYEMVRAVERNVIRAFGTDEEISLLDQPWPEDGAPKPATSELPAEHPARPGAEPASSRSRNRSEDREEDR